MPPRLTPRARICRFVLLTSMLCSLGLVRTSVAQNASIGGRVVDAETGEPLPGVNVFLDQTTRGSATDQDGRYEIEPLSPGSYRVVASVVGYSMESGSVEIVPDRTDYTMNFRLSPTVVELNEVQVEADQPRDWERNYRRFEQAFLGATSNAQETEILNPYVLDFEMESGELQARSSAPLEIENRALGYGLTFVLVHFRAGRLVSMGGAVHFRELEAADEAEAARWRENREAAYRGSLTHLLRSLVAGNSRTEGFFVAHEIRAGYYQPRRRLDLDFIPILEAGDRPYLYRLFFEHPLYVEFGRGISLLRMTRDEATLHADGYLYTSAADVAPVAVHGDMSKRRIADMLPRDYGLTGDADQE